MQLNFQKSIGNIPYKRRRISSLLCYIFQNVNNLKFHIAILRKECYNDTSSCRKDVRLLYEDCPPEGRNIPKKGTSLFSFIPFGMKE